MTKKHDRAMDAKLLPKSTFHRLVTFHQILQVALPEIIMEAIKFK